MQNIFEQLKELLKKDERLVSQDGLLLKNQAQELARKNDSNLIKLLFSDKAIKNHFFFKVDEVLIFDKEKFIRFVSNKQFLPDSYTAFKNKIGFITGDNSASSAGGYLSENKEVVLVWPYKDCVLEGGMTKEDQKRDEIFYNETLAPDDITFLLDPKVFTNFKRIDKNGEHKLDGFKRDEKGNIKDNFIIKGNNLLALTSLKKEFAGKVKLIYIDPPYNTGNDGFKYNDSFNHSSWLTFMKNRLDIAKELLSDDGVIFVQLDQKENHYCKVLMDDIFGRENFVSQISWERSATAGLGMGGKIIDVTEYILVYQKKNIENNFNNNVFKQVIYDTKEFLNYKILENEGSKELVEKYLSTSGEEIKIFKHKNYIIRKSTEDDFKNNFVKFFRTFLIQKENNFQHSLISKMDGKTLYSVEYTPSRGKHKGKLTTNYYYNKELFSWLKDLSIFENGKIIKNEKVNNFWDRKFISNAARGEGGIIGIDRMKKPEKLISFILELATKPNDLVLDFFAGSGTTLAVAHKMGRQYIGIEQMDYIHDLPESRLKKVIGKKVKKSGKLIDELEFDQGGISKAVNWKGGGEFVYMELARWNELIMERIEEAKTDKQLAALCEELKENTFLSWKIDPETMMDAKSKAFTDLSIADKKKFLIEILDKNQLYVNLSEIKDKEYGVSEEDKKLNGEFYE